jgi:hexokinase
MHAFGEGMNERYTKQKQKLMKLHRDQLPPEPQKICVVRVFGVGT